MSSTVTPDQALVNDRIVATAHAMRGMSTHDAETQTSLGNGHVACAYSVNKVLDAAIGRTYGANRDSVTSVADDLKRHGDRVAVDDVRPGDIAVRLAGEGERHGHIGFVIAGGATPEILSNSSTHGSFSSVQAPAAFGRNYAGHGEDTVEFFRIDPKSVDLDWVRRAPAPDPAHALGPNRAPLDPTHWTEHRPGAIAHLEPAAPGTPAAPSTTNALPGLAFGAEITAAAQRHHLDPVLLGAVAAQETGGPGAMQGRNIVGDHGHGHGVFQIDDRWHAFASTPAAMDPAQNAEYAAGMLRGLIDRNGGDVRTALHDYNAGSPHRASTTTPWADGTTLSYEDSVLRHETELRAHLGRGAHDAPVPAAPAPPQTDYTRPHADRILGETHDGRLVETKAELETKNALLSRAERDAREGRIDDIRFVGDGRESAREVARQNEKLWRGVEANLPANGAPPLPPERRDGYTQSGRIASVSEGIVLQDIGRGQTAAYAARDFASPPVAGESYTISYHDGVATATENRAQHQALGRP